MRRARTVVMASVALALIGEGEARACSCVWWGPGAGRLYLGANGSLPPDVRGFAWGGPEPLVGSPGRVSVVRIEAKRRVPVKHRIAAGEDRIEWIVLAKKFAPGQVYEVTVREGEYAAQSRREWSALQDEMPPAVGTTTVTIAAAPLKLAQPGLHAGAPAQRPLTVSAPAVCSETFTAAVVPLRVELPPEVEPMRDHLVFATRVDGKPWTPRPGSCTWIDPGRTWTREAGTDLLFTVCERDPQSEYRAALSLDGLTPGLHRVEIEVATPDRRQVVVTPAIDVMLACAPPPPLVARSAPPPANEPPANEPPANEPPANEPPANEPPAAAQPQEPPPVASRGCNVGEPGFAWVLGAVWWWRRRRTTRR
ncbi:hypothetical protein [Nannocystis punicea]|uniref:MYXO-CTERM domain-containing protein n=1 Tax=Nannocystis punicea TaxID=2995304 RepID=A0ABY7H6E7_9BACT|nr:hypothetical protein [Nannocystis poenicansa]WAS94554.1 hypothetical protein O0S08_00205 [Nannocystis poenicansa]